MYFPDFSITYLSMPGTSGYVQFFLTKGTSCYYLCLFLMSCVSKHLLMQEEICTETECTDLSDSSLSSLIGRLAQWTGTSLSHSVLWFVEFRGGRVQRSLSLFSDWLIMRWAGTALSLQTSTTNGETIGQQRSLCQTHQRDVHKNQY